MNNDAQRMLERARLRKVEFENHIKKLDEDLESEAQQLLGEKETELTSWNSENDKENSDSITSSNYVLRNAVKLKLDKLGKLYAGEEVSSPIHRTIDNDSVSPNSVGLPAGKLSQARRARFAALANTINNWEDDLASSKKTSPVKVGLIKPKVLGNRNNQEIKKQCNVGNEVKKPVKETKKVLIEDSIAKTLEAQGFQRCESKQHLVFDYKSPSNSPGKCHNKIISQSPVKSPVKITPKIGVNKELIKDVSQPTNNAHRFLPSGMSSQPCEVLKMAAKYEVATSPKKTFVKDPAELPLADRKALFERGDNGTAILPKAPFAMAVPTKVLRSDDSKINTPLPKTPNCKITPGPVRTPHLASTLRQAPALETPERPTVGDNVTREILERRREIEELRNRWDKKRKEVENKFPSDVGSLNNTPTSPSRNIPIPPPMPFGENSFSSPSTFKNNSLIEVLKSPGTSPKKERKSSVSPGVKIALEGIKPIRVSPPKSLYPSIADIETDSDFMEEERQSDLETISEAGEDRISDNSECTSEAQDVSIESEDSAQSFGKHIVASSRENSRSNLKRSSHSLLKTYPHSANLNSSDSSIETSNGSKDGSEENITADESRVLHEIDDFLDEALGEPTPPKKVKEENKKEDTYIKTEKQYSKPCIVSAELKVPADKPTIIQKQHTPSDESSNNFKAKESDGPSTPLVYTVSLYRKQQTSLLKTPIKKEVHADVSKMEVDSPEESFCEEELVKQKMEELQIEIKRQVVTISQASQALNHCMATIKFSGSTEELEAEKLLLLATSRRIAATHELERLTVEQKLYPGGKSEIQEDGTLKIESLSVKAKRIPSALDETIHLLCLVKSGCTVQATEILPLTRQALTDGNRLVFKKPVQIEKVRHNLQTTVEVYALTNKSFMHHMRGEFSKEKLKLTPKKSSKKENKRNFGVVESPAGPNAIRSPSFQLIGFVVFSLKDITRNHFTLNKVPGNSPIEGFLEMKVKGQVNLDNIRHEGFLTLFQEIGGFGAWKRAWCILKGHHLSFCCYPDPERAMASCFETIDLSECITREVGLAPKDVCVRTDTVMLECRRVGIETEIIRYLLSADSLQERLEWCHYINKVLNLLRLWNPVNKT
ncbi:anillin-like isoform X2 [Rhodnius prolixus]|uniref:anillin-like isoform X2 n=1 Tax=Rhodnius prolixus TaxID=13249 RepID=UPI003D18A1CE